MTGMFPNNGVPAGATQNGVDVPTVPGCDELFYAPRCNPRMDPYAQNALISEILNVVDGADNVYDCGQINNLFLAIQKMTKQHVISATRDVGGEGTLPLPVNGSGAEVIITTGTIDIPNTSNSPIDVIVSISLHAIFQFNPTTTSRYVLGFNTFTDSAMTQPFLRSHVIMRGIGAQAGPTNSFDCLPANFEGITVPPGGLVLYYNIGGSSDVAGNQATNVAGRLVAFGVGVPAGSTIDN